jgi:hypothetical protein
VCKPSDRLLGVRSKPLVETLSGFWPLPPSSEIWTLPVLTGPPLALNWPLMKGVVSLVGPSGV